MIGRLLHTFSIVAVGRSLLVALLFSYSVIALFEARFAAAPIVAAAILAGFGLLAVLRMPPKQSFAIGLVGLALLFWFVVSTLLARDGSDPDKIRQMGLTLLVFGVLSAFAMLDRAVMDRLPTGFMLVGGFAFGLLIFAPGTYQEGRVSFDDNNPIWMARSVGLLGIGALAFYLRNRTHVLVYMAIFMVAAAGVIMTGSRGPLTGMILCAGLMVILSRGATRLNLILLGGFAALVLSVAFAGFAPVDEVRGLTFSSNDDSSAIRLAMYDYTLRTISENPSGIGVGWFIFEGLKWPHNIYLELFVEWGWLTGVGFVIFTLIGVVGLFSLGGRYDTLKLLLVYDLVNSSLSGEVTSPRFLYALLIVGAASLVYKVLWPQPMSRAEFTSLAGVSATPTWTHSR